MTKVSFWDRRLRAIGVLCVLLAIIVGAVKDCVCGPITK